MTIHYLNPLGPHDLRAVAFADVLVCRGHRFESFGREPYVRKDGTMSEVLVLWTCCHDCGAGYEIRASLTHTKDFRMRCDACKKPHVPVRPGQPKRRAGAG